MTLSQTLNLPSALPVAESRKPSEPITTPWQGFFLRAFFFHDILFSSPQVERNVYLKVILEHIPTLLNVVSVDR